MCVCKYIYICNRKNENIYTCVHSIEILTSSIDMCVSELFRRCKKDQE